MKPQEGYRCDITFVLRTLMMHGDSSAERGRWERTSQHPSFNQREAIVGAVEELARFLDLFDFTVTIVDRTDMGRPS